MAGTSKSDDSVIIVGAGVFGLSTAVHLAQRGYRNVRVFDKQPYEQTKYSYFNGCDAASADINKIIRAAYGGEVEYQRMTLEAITEWRKWNQELSDGQTLPADMRRSDKIFYPTGHLVLNDGDELPDFERQTIANMNSGGHDNSQLVMSDAGHRDRATQLGMGYAIDPFHQRTTKRSTLGVLDTTGGFVAADLACRFALCKAKQLGVDFTLGPTAGAFKSLLYEDGTRVTGIETADGRHHRADMTIIACGGWTPTLLTSLDGLCETTAGSVFHLKIPQDSKLFERFAPSNFPSWQYNMRAGASGGLYGFPRDEEGWFKIGYRGTKYTNPQKQHDGCERSVPLTKWSEPSIKEIPVRALEVTQTFLDDFLPELGAAGINISATRLCWYTDSFDNHYVVDFVPGLEGLMVATGGSGHAFKMLPILGKYIADVLEGNETSVSVTKLWRWRSPSEGQKASNVLMEGDTGDRSLSRIAKTSVG